MDQRSPQTDMNENKQDRNEGNGKEEVHKYKSNKENQKTVKEVAEEKNERVKKGSLSKKKEGNIRDSSDTKVGIQGRDKVEVKDQTNKKLDSNGEKYPGQ